MPPLPTTTVKLRSMTARNVRVGSSAEIGSPTDCGSCGRNSGGPKPVRHVRGSVESMQTVKLELSPEAHKLLAQPQPVVAKVPIMLGSNPIDRPRTSPR
jgi:hypothetical protein